MLEASGSLGASNEYLLERYRQHKDRRRFLLFAVFDFALILILWVIFTVTKSPDWRKDFLEQCGFESSKFFTVSLFDVTILSLGRCAWLIIWYACFGIDHWWPVAASTALSSVFLLTKVVYFFLESTNQTNNPLAYAIPICSFVIAWVELYLLDGQVLPRERQNRDNLGYITHDANKDLPNDLPTSSGGHVSDYQTATELSSESEDDNKEKKITVVGGPLENGEILYKTYGRLDFLREANRAMVTCKYIYGTLGNWNLKNSSPLIRTSTFKTYGQYFYLKLETQVCVEALFDLLYTYSFNIPQWNNLVLEVKTLLRLDNNMDVSYSVTAPALRNYICSRDFLDVRAYEVHEDRRTFCIVNKSVRSDLRPPSGSTKLIRGENGPCLCILRPNPLDANLSIFEWIMNTHLKGSLPKRLVNRALVQFLLKFASNLERQLKTMQ